MTVQEFFDSMDYGPAPEGRGQVDAWLESRGARFGLYIDGVWTDPGEETLPTYAPSTGEKLAAITIADQDDVDRAVGAARRAQGAWEKLGCHGRARFLYALARSVQKHSRLLAVLESLDNGKPIRETRDLDIPLVARHFYHHAGWAQVRDEEFPRYEPVGVAGQVIPWNFPLLMLAWKIAPALAAGNTVVLKPAEFTSLTALKFAEICDEINLPKGVVNIVTGAGSTGAALVDADVDKIAFTGSTEVGQIIRRSIAGTGKKLTLELGGKSPYIVFDDADMDSAVEGLVDAIWFNQGQVCCAGSRLLVQEGIADRFLEKVRARMQSLRVGDSLDKCIDIGAIIDQVQKDRVEELLAKGQAEGATLWRAPCDLPDQGVYLAPILATDIGPDNTLMREEIFGPVLAAMTFRTQSEAVALANNSIYGLAASVWSENLSRALEVAPALKAGVVWVNGTNMFDAAVGFGGVRQSGFGREGGREGMLAYMKPTYEKSLKDLKAFKPGAQSSKKKTTKITLTGVDRTAKHYIGGKQTRPDGGDSMPVIGAKGDLLGQVALGNRKDIRNAVEAAEKASAWSGSTAHLRAQILYFLAENMAIRSEELAKRLQALTGVTASQADKEAAASVSRLFSAAAMADKVDGLVHQPPMRGVALAMNEPQGVVAALLSDEAPLLSLTTLVAFGMASANRMVLVPGEYTPLIATDFYQLLETSDVPAGVVNIVTGKQADLAGPLAAHHGVDAIWQFGPRELSAEIEELAALNMKWTWLSYGKAYDWFDADQMNARSLMERGYEVKSIWVPYGDQNATGKAY